MRDSSAQVVASFPPPTVGQAVVTERVTAELRKRGNVATYDWLPNSNYGPIQRIRKAMLSLIAPLWIVWGRLRGRKTVYTVANSGWGLLYNIVALTIARCVGCRCILHHHAVSYLQNERTLMRWLDRILGRRDCHVVLAPEMKDMLRQNYESKRQIRILANGFLIDNLCSTLVAESASAGPQGPTAVGHLSNLCLSKGIDIVINTFRDISRQYPDSKLILAGPTFSADAARIVRHAQHEFGARLDYLGPVYGSDKEVFFQSIGVMLYPTRDDAQPLVLLESLAYGVPTLATSVGCIGSLVRTPEWIAEEQHFSPSCLALVRRWIEDATAFGMARQRARMVARQACEESHQQLDEFCSYVFRKAA